MSRVRFEHSTFLQTLIIYPVLFTALYLEYFIDSFLLCLVISAFFWFALRAIWRKCRKKSLEENYRPYPDYTNPTQTALQAHEPYSNTTPNPVRVGPSLVKPVAENPNPITIEKPKPLILDPPMPRLSPADMFAIADGWWVSQITEFRACTTVDTPVPLPDKSDRFIFSSMSAPGTTYITSMRGCTCPAYTTGKTIPCKHMVRLALFRGYYDIRYPANRAHGNIQFDGSHGDDVEHPTCLLYTSPSPRD